MAALLDRHLTTEDPGFVSLVTIAELVWVLRSVYGYSAQQVAAAVEKVLLVESIEFQNRDEVYAAMLLLRAGRGSFDDALIVGLSAWAGCDRTLTFDRRAARLPGVELL